MPPRHHLANIPPGNSSPLEYAVRKRDEETLNMVADAVRYKQALLAYQPVVRAQTTNSVAFYEGLIRVLDATGRVIPAADFMPVVENEELGRTIDTLSLAMGCKALAEVPNLRLSINMSARSIGYRPWLRTLNRWLDKDDSIGPRLILEITESSAMTVPELVVDFMDRLQMRGICFALDDFGSGYTALRYFKDFFFDIIKIDGQFIKGIARDPDNLVLTQAMLSIAKQFDMLCVAEMVETPEDAEVLTKIGVDCMQGFNFGAPTIKPDWLPRSGHMARRRA
ncbi:EAL domain-containing protein [Aliishimia ponticola]|uniref:EAL domain-containing protein n=1 Tax=Aliishimia ponticola TaxID=2499833 RepID=A0A4S4NH11_9RHOB|nr:EAL domain-containing protein [Aliishimia ponticola]THH37468.1 EAL domain-containing protein [Aliishimia ponticola]